MSVYGASFVQVVGAQVPNGSGHPYRPTSSGVAFEEAAFEFICKQITDSNRSWLEVSPEHIAADHTVRTHEGSRWISIQNAFGDDLLESLSRDLSTETVGIYCVDEKLLSFDYQRCMGGAVKRAISYSQWGKDNQVEKDAVWRTVSGEAEPWEAEVFFSEESLTLYRKYSTDEQSKEQLEQLSRDRSLVTGFSLPWAANSQVVKQIAEALELPWDVENDEFPDSNKRHTIAGRDTDGLTTPRMRRPWWKLW